MIAGRAAKIRVGSGEGTITRREEALSYRSHICQMACVRLQYGLLVKIKSEAGKRRLQKNGATP